MPAQASQHSTSSTATASDVTWLQWMAAAFIGTALALLMWHGLLQDTDLTGGDTWPYFFPQKMVLAESLAADELPVWHDVTALGYPLLAESQAGVFYPSNQLLYRLLDINLAYYVSIVGHYVLAYVFAWRFIRCQQVSHWASLLAAMVFVYGWFPARISLEWSIIGGVWLPLTLWITHEFLNRPSRWKFAALTTCLSLHLLAGHFTLAFINQLCLVTYAGIQLLLRPAASRPALTTTAAVPAAILLSLMLSAAQLLPSMELKQVSQREGARTEFNPGYGHMPPVYVTQLLASWTWWHTPEILQDGRLQRLPGSIDVATNAVEAHFYLGLIPLMLVAAGLFSRARRRTPVIVRRTWLILGACSLLYATGWLLPITRHLPGFSYFMGPGRYTIVATLAGAILCGCGLDALMKRRSVLIISILIAGPLTWIDLRWSSAPVADAIEVPAILKHQDESWVRDYFRRQPPRTCRLLASGPNVANLFEVSCVPQYLGIGPSVYFSDQFDLITKPDQAEFVSPDQITRLQELGVTHVLTTEPADQFADVLVPVDARPDALLNRIWGRGGSPCYLYQLRQPGQRLHSDPPAALTSWKQVQATPSEVTLEISLDQDAQVHLKELMYPGWTAEVDGQPVDPVPGTSVTRCVAMSAGTHTLRWSFQSGAVHLGLWISCLTFLGCWLSPLIPLQKHSAKEPPK